MDYRRVLAPLMRDCADSLYRSFGRNWAFVRKSNFRDVSIPLEIECEERVRDSILRSFPQDGFVGEETPAVASASGRYWVFDPLCGTSNYIRGIPEFAVSMAVVYNASTVFSYVLIPAHSLECYAERGLGTVVNGNRARVSDVGNFDASIIAMGQRVLARPEYSRVAEAVSRNSLRARISAAANLELAYLASGRIDGYVNVDQAYHDCLSGALLIEEAGGKVAGVNEGMAPPDPGFAGKRVPVVVAGNPVIYATLAGLLHG